MRENTEISLLQWIAGGAIGLISAIALGFASTTSHAENSLQTKQTSDELKISQTANSICIENENIQNLAVAVKASFVSDPSCQNNNQNSNQ